MKVAQGGGFPGFDGIRLCAAWAVVYSHCYLIAGGPTVFDPLSRLLGEPLSFGGYAVKIFFIMSGFLLSASLDSKVDPLRFLVNRLFRIVPGFLFSMLATVLLIAPLLYKMNFVEILTSGGIWRALFWSVADLGDYIGIDRPASRYAGIAGTLNGSLWSIPYEVVSYLVLLALYMLLRSHVRVALAAFMLLVVTVLGPHLGLTTVRWGSGDAAALRLPMAFFEGSLPYFCGGVLFYSCHKRWGVPSGVVLVALAVLSGTASFGLHDVALAVIGPVVVAWIGARESFLSRLTDRIGDVSYGVYLFGWPVSLLVASLSGSTNPLVVFALSVPPVFVFAYAMHRLVEVPVANTIKPAVLRWLPRFARSFGELPVGQRAAQIVAYSICLVISVRFVIYPYPFGLNWYGPLWPQLAAVCLVMALLLWAGERFGRRA